MLTESYMVRLSSDQNFISSSYEDVLFDNIITSTGSNWTGHSLVYPAFTYDVTYRMIAVLNWQARAWDEADIISVAIDGAGPPDREYMHVPMIEENTIRVTMVDGIFTFHEGQPGVAKITVFSPATKPMTLLADSTVVCYEIDSTDV